jgi:uncharacterized protein involved in exopolysaccharide biosynthesis
MILKLVETFFRYKWLIILPPFLIPLIVGPVAVLNAPWYYETHANVWVDKADYLPGASSTFNIYLSPAQNQINRVTDQLKTRTFLLDIASRTPYAELAKTPAGEERFRQVFFRGFSMFPSGEHVITIRFRGTTPEQTVLLTNALIETFKDRVTADRMSQAELATGFYETRLVAAQAELEKANDALRRYVAANPRLTTIDPNAGAASTGAARLGLPASAIDPQMAELLRRVDLAQKDVDTLRTSLEGARLNTSAAIQGQEVGFRLVDAPQPPNRPIRERRKALIYPAAGAVVGFGLSAALLVLLVASDRTVRNESDLSQIARVVGTVPRLRLAGGQKRVSTETLRRAIGFSAGAALPEPSGAK